MSTRNNGSWGVMPRVAWLLSFVLTLCFVLAADSAVVSASAVGATEAAGAIPVDEIDLERLFADVSSVRQLPILAQVPADRVNRAGLRAYLANMVAKEVDPERYEKARVLNTLLGLLGEGVDLRELTLEEASRSIAGLYDPEGKRIEIRDYLDEASGELEWVMAHEYVHALQDQNLRLAEVAKAAQVSQDRAMAFSSLSEGDATLAELLYARSQLEQDRQGLDEGEEVDDEISQIKTPRIAPQIGTSFRYRQGARFVAKLYKEGGWAAVDGAYADPPVTTEQVLHPEKYLDREGSVEVETPRLLPGLGPDWELWDTNTLGELGLIYYLSPGMTPKRAATAAAGWAGDKTILLKSTRGEHLLVVSTVWDTEKDAVEFFRSLALLQQRRAGITRDVQRNPQRVSWSGKRREGFARLDGDSVLFCVGSTRETVAAISAALDGAK